MLVTEGAPGPGAPYWGKCYHFDSLYTTGRSIVTRSCTNAGRSIITRSRSNAAPYRAQVVPNPYAYMLACCCEGLGPALC